MNKQLVSLILFLSLIATAVTAFAKVGLTASASATTPTYPAGYVLATDADFSGSENGKFKYIGSAEYIIIPHVIKGVPITSYEYMFLGFPNRVAIKGVYSDNLNITSAHGMFYHSYAKSIDISNMDLSSVIDVTDIFGFTFATQVFTKTQVDADRLNAIDFHAPVTFSVK